MRVSHTAINWLALIAMVLMWGLSFSMMKLSLENIGPYWLAVVRVGLAIILVGAVCIAMKARLPRGWREWWAVSLFGLASNSIPFLLIGWASIYVPSGTAGLMMATSPILVMLISIVALPEEKATVLRIIGLIVGFIGAGMVIAGRDATVAAFMPTTTSIWPYIALLGGATCYALATIIGRKFLDLPLMTRSFGALITGGAVVLVGAVLLEPLPTALPRETIGALIYLGVFPTAVTTIGVLWLLERSSASFVAQSNYLVPVSAVVFGAIIFSEHLGWMQYAGMVIILCGIAITYSLRHRRPQVPQA